MGNFHVFFKKPLFFSSRYYEPDRSDGGGAYSDAKEEGGISTLTIAIAACAGVLLLVALAAIVAIIMVTHFIFSRKIIIYKNLNLNFL